MVLRIRGQVAVLVLHCLAKSRDALDDFPSSIFLLKLLHLTTDIDERVE